MIQMTMHQDEASGRRYYAPVLCCDVCGEPITDLDLSIYKWKNDAERRPVPGTFALLHKGDCDTVHNQRYNAEDWLWNEGTTMVGLMINNAQGRDKMSVNLWADLVEHYCPAEQLADVQRVSASILRNPENRPPSINDLS